MIAKSNVLIFGAQHLGKIVASIFQDNGILIYGFLDDNPVLKNTTIKDVSVLSTADDRKYWMMLGDQCQAFIAMDHINERKELINRINKEYPGSIVNALHSSVILTNPLHIGYGNLLNAGVIISAHVKIGNHCLIHTHTTIEQNVTIQDFVQIGAGSIVNDNVVINENTFIGTGVTIVAGIKIGKNVRVGAGSVVLADIDDNMTVLGNPAKLMNI